MTERRKFDTWLNRGASLTTIASFALLVWGMAHPPTVPSAGVGAPSSTVNADSPSWNQLLTNRYSMPLLGFIVAGALYSLAAIIARRTRKLEYKLEVAQGQVKTRDESLAKLSEALEKSQKYGRELERTNLELRTSLSGSSRIQFYQGRRDQRPSLVELFNTASSLWIATHEATNLRGQGLIKAPLKKLILLDPKGMSVEVFASTEGAAKTVEEIRKDIDLATREAAKNGVDVRTFDGPITAMIIADPRSGDGWAQIETYMPWSEEHGRPSILLRQRDYPDCFGLLVEVFELMWEKPVPQAETRKELDHLTQQYADYKKSYSTLHSTCEQHKKDLELKQKELAAETTKLSEISNSFRAFRVQDGRWRIIQCGKADTSLGLTVAVYFIDSRDSDLAKMVRGFFSSEIPGWSPWKTLNVEQIPWRENPSSRARIVIFSDHPNAGGVKAAFNDCELLPERVDRFDKQTGMLVDVMIVIFDKVGRDD